MDWFERLTGFHETNYDDTRARLRVEGSRLQSLVNRKTYQIGQLELVSLQTLRDRASAGPGLPGRLNVSVVTGDVRKMHHLPEYAGAMFQVASQFNLLEMTSYEVTPEDGVTRYQYDLTQGPACAIAAGAATIYRTYFAPVGGVSGQTRNRQFDGLADLGNALSSALGQPISALWNMQNGYALCTLEGLNAIAHHLSKLTSDELEDLRGKLCIGIHRDIEVTDATGKDRPLVSQAFCSALPVAYTQIPHFRWEPFASLVLQAAYEATMWASVHNAQHGTSNIVLLTSLGGSAFGNDPNWIHDAMWRALKMMSKTQLDVRLVSYGQPDQALMQMAEESLGEWPWLGSCREHVASSSLNLSKTVVNQRKSLQAT
jgi:hypothetical protein